MVKFIKKPLAVMLAVSMATPFGVFAEETDNSAVAPTEVVAGNPAPVENTEVATETPAEETSSEATESETPAENTESETPAENTESNETVASVSANVLENLEFVDFPEYGHVVRGEETFKVKVNFAEWKDSPTAQRVLFPVVEGEQCVVAENYGPITMDVPNSEIDENTKTFEIGQEVELNTADYVGKKVCAYAFVPGTSGNVKHIYAQSEDTIKLADKVKIYFENQLTGEKVTTDEYPAETTVENSLDELQDNPELDGYTVVDHEDGEEDGVKTRTYFVQKTNPIKVNVKFIDEATNSAIPNEDYAPEQYVEDSITELLDDPELEGYTFSKFVDSKEEDGTLVRSYYYKKNETPKPTTPTNNSSSSSSSGGGSSSSGGGSSSGSSGSSSSSSSSTTSVVASNNSNNTAVKSDQAVNNSSAIFTDFTKKCEQTIFDLTDPRLVEYYKDINVINQADVNRPLTRAEFLKLLLNSGKVDVSKEENPNYSDVPATHTLAKYIAYATRTGLVSGHNNQFRPDEYISRAEAAKIVINSIGVPLAKEATTFSDVAKTNSLSLYIQTAYDNCILNGRKTRGGETTLANGVRVYEPESSITLGETGKILYNITHK